MQRPAATELEFDRVLALVGAFARSAAGRKRIESKNALPTVGEGVLAARLTLEVETLLAEQGTLSFAGLDEAAFWLGPAAPPPHAVEELMSLLACARRTASVRRTLLGLPAELELLHDLGERIPDTQGLVEWAAARLGRDGRIPDSASPTLAALRRQGMRARREILQKLEALRRAHPDAATDSPPTMRRDRYCLPIRREARGQLRGLVLASSGSGATLFVEPYEIVEMNNDLTEALSREREEVQRILDEVAAAFTAARPELAAAGELLARLDEAQARALFGRILSGRVVPPGGGDELVLRGARHPLLDERLAAARREILGEPRRAADRPVVPLDFRLPEDVRTLVISGPNAGGKTVVLKTLGLMVMMAYHGIPLPVDEGTSIPEISALFCHIGDEQDVSADLSTFSATMANTARILEHTDASSLVLLDELGAGTDPLEGAALGCALLEDLTARGALTVASTHLAAIAMTVSAAEGMENAAMEYDEDAGRPTYGLRIGRPGRSHGLEIAAAMGLPASVLDRARELLGGEHLQLEHWLRRLEKLEGELLDRRSALAAKELEIESLRAELESEREGLRRARRSIPEELAAERDKLRRRARSQLDAALAEIEAAEKERRHLGRRRRDQIRAKALDLAEQETPRQSREAAFAPGEAVRIASLGGRGVIQEIRGSNILVNCSGKHVWVDSNDLLADPSGRPTPQAAVSISVDEAVPGELQLRGMDALAARDELEHYLDRAYAAGKSEVRVVHGHGTGTLRRMVEEVCRTHPAVRSFAHPPRARGGTGAMEIRIKGPDDE